ncbi:pre-60S ribosomal particles component [Lecanora helva]
MAVSITKKRKVENNTHELAPSRKARKQEYHSSPSTSATSSGGEDEDGDDFTAVDLADSDPEAELERSPSQSPPNTANSSNEPSSVPDSASDLNSSDESENSSTSEPPNPAHPKKKSKRNDPSAFASSINAILSSKLSTSKRSDPVLARSTVAAEANASIANTKLETKARQKLREDKKAALEKGRVKDVLLGTDIPGVGDGGEEGGGVGGMLEEEKRLKKVAQRGVVKLFNAVRQAQVKGEEAARGSKGATRARKEEKVGEMSKKGFLELVAGGGKAGGAKRMEGKQIEES